jgi:hypothetical protein
MALSRRAESQQDVAPGIGPGTFSQRAFDSLLQRGHAGR